MQKIFLNFLDSMAKTSGQHSLVESIKQAFITCESIVDPIKDEPDLDLGYDEDFDAYEGDLDPYDYAREGSGLDSEFEVESDSPEIKPSHQRDLFDYEKWNDPAWRAAHTKVTHRNADPIAYMPQTWPGESPYIRMGETSCLRPPRVDPKTGLVRPTGDRHHDIRDIWFRYDRNRDASKYSGGAKVYSTGHDPRDGFSSEGNEVRDVFNQFPDEDPKIKWRDPAGMDDDNF